MREANCAPISGKGLEPSHASVPRSFDNIDSQPCQPILGEIDTLLAQQDGFTDEELDFILNYDME